MDGSYRVTIDHHLRGRRAGIAEFPCKKGQRPNLPSARGRSHRRGEGTRASAAGLHPSFLSDRSSTSPPQPPFFRSFPPFLRSQAELDRPVCVAMFFFARRRPNPAESLENAIRDGSKNNFGRKCFHIPLRAAARAPNPAPFPVISTGAPAPGRGSVEKSGGRSPPENSGDATGQCLGPAAAAGRVSPLRLRSRQAASLRSK